jgi:hypothetical protein
MEIVTSNNVPKSITVEARSKAQVCGIWLVGIMGSNPSEGMDALLV